MQYELFMKGELISCITSQFRFLSYKDNPSKSCDGALRIMDEVDLFLDSNKNYLYRF